MKKSVYSLVLMDDVVEAIDRMAYSMNTSRSNLINQVLAEYASLTTPEKRMNDIFNMVKSTILPYRDLQIQDMLSDSMMAVKSTLKYKYNPTVRYTVELYRNTSEAVGQLKVSLRTQSPALIDAVNRFFMVWAELEGLDKQYYRIEDGRYTRIFTADNQMSNQEIAGQISRYIKKLDDCMKAFFNNIEQPAEAKALVSKLYHTDA